MMLKISFIIDFFTRFAKYVSKTKLIHPWSF
jgi:hypothetical protein